MDTNIACFLIRAKKDVFADRANFESSRPSSKDKQYSEGNLKYIDSFFGEINFAGEEVLLKNDVTFWAMNYIGRVLSEDVSMESLWRFLEDALLLVPKEHPYRGPLHYAHGEYAYKCTISGNFDWFSGAEEIYHNGVKVYELMFHGGYVK